MLRTIKNAKISVEPIFVRCRRPRPNVAMAALHQVAASPQIRRILIRSPGWAIRGCTMETLRTVISLLALVVSVLALFWGDAIRRLFVRSKLSVGLASGKGHKTVWNNEIPMYFYHLRVKNSRRTAAMNVEVLLMRLETASSFGADFKAMDLRNRIQLAWPYPSTP